MAQQEKGAMMTNGALGRIVHLNFRRAQDCELFYLKLEKETGELIKEALQRTVIKVDEKSLVLFAIYANGKDADTVLARVGPWIQTFKEDDALDILSITGDIVINELQYNEKHVTENGVNAVAEANASLGNK
ncbi:MAG: hypothetical protein CML56_10380 [Rhodobacteraceae bacterium]|nr:hypothetical protein [Paracoccaceae bacterium]|tara:strand:+ start:11 stop:406 length:396 start_codon:yes stop_codon:yes gene_type:complete